MTNPNELKGQELLDYYRDALVACHGESMASSFTVRYRRGWYYVTADGFCTPFRATQIREMTAALLRRAKEDKDE